MKPAEIRLILDKIGGGAVHARGQNFLLDEAVVAAMAEAAGVHAGSRVLEIGPGLGVLTAELLRRGAFVVAVEVDARWVRHLRERFVDESPCLVEGDVRDWSNRRLREQFTDATGDYQVVANLPYAVTSAVLAKFLLEEPKPTSMTVMVQREVADRVLAGRGDMSSLAVLVQTFGEPQRIRQVPRASFYPAPRVDSTVIHIKLKTSAQLAEFFGDVDPERYFAVVRAGFSVRRRQLRNSLGSLVKDRGKLEKALIEAKIDPKVRPEELLPTDWARLASRLSI